MREGTSRLWVLLVVTLALVVPSSVQAAGFVNVSKDSAQLTFSPSVSNMRFVLTVSGNDQVVRQEERGPFSFSVFGLADGEYTYELRAEPIVDAAMQKALQQARETGDYTAVKQLRVEGQLPGEAMVQSGSFRVANGSLVLPMQESKPVASDSDNGTAKDQVFVDDVIVIGSLCVGVDCVNGESFGFDTIRLKENNLRIKFQDTSSSASFPSNDWQLTANDSANGGANKFSIDDIDGGRTPFTIEASAPNNALYVDDGGRLGLGTATPVVDIHAVTGNTPTLRLDQNGSSGFTPQAWDVAGNEANFFIRDVTNGSKLPFRIKPGTPTNSLFLSDSGNIGINTDSPATNLEIFKGSDDNFGFRLNRQDNVEWVVQLNKSTDATSPNGLAFTKAGTGSREMEIQEDGDVYILGNIYSNGTQLTVPDFVFAPDYELMPLDELADFVSNQRHLPSIPSSAEIGEQGLNLTGMQLQLLQKVEELTLYTISQQGELDTAHQTIESLQETIQQLNQRLLALEQSAALEQ